MTVGNENRDMHEQTTNLEVTENKTDNIYNLYEIIGIFIVIGILGLIFSYKSLIDDWNQG